MKKTCEGCRALGMTNGKPRCALRYQQLPTLIDGMRVSARPGEECPKPRTWRDYIRISDARRAAGDMQ